MDLLEHCIYLMDNKLNKMVDKTVKVESIAFNDKTMQYNVKFIDGGTYNYNKTSVIWRKDPVEVDVKDKAIYVRGTYISNIIKVLFFEEWTRVFYKTGHVASYPSSDIKIINNYANTGKTSTFLNYLLEVAQVVKEWNVEEGFLEKEISNLFVSNESILYKLINDEKILTRPSNTLIISPWQSNKAQLEAIRNALSSSISVIQGPPGTGKTQTILNLISNLLVQDKTIAVLAGNNEAVSNVYEKLKENGLAGICAVLGNTDHVKDFLSQDHDDKELASIFNAENRNINECLKLSAAVNDIYNTQAELSKLNNEFNEALAQFRVLAAEHPNTSKAVPEQISRIKLSIDNTLILASYIETLNMKRRITLLNRFKARFKYKLKNIKSIVRQSNTISIYFQKEYYKILLLQLKDKIKEIQKKLAEIDEKTIIKQYCESSALYLRSILKKHFSKVLDKPLAPDKSYRYNFTSFTNRFPIVFSTTHSLAHCSQRGFLYDYVIIDESSQVDLCSAAIALSCAKNIVCVGDLKQLPHVVTSANLNILKDVFAKYKLDNCFDYAKHSLLDSLTSKYGKEIKNTILNEHYRCDPEIIGFCNRRFYNDELLVHTDHSEGNGIKIITTEPHYARNRSNPRQVDIILQDILPSIKEGSIGIVAPYRDQVELLQNNIQNQDIVIDTVHKFQGKECDTIILSTVSNKAKIYEDPDRCDFLNNENLINVAISRAKKNLYIVASKELLMQDHSLMHDLARYLTYYAPDSSIKETSVYSVFDLMYDSYSPVLEMMRKKMLRITDEDSENIVANVLLDLQIKYEQKFGFVLHYSLNRIINAKTITDPEDKNFVQNCNTHCDFVLYRKLDKSIMFAIEVDGSQHNSSRTQRQRDERKDRILTLVGIPVIRIGTTETNIEERLSKIITKIL